MQPGRVAIPLTLLLVSLAGIFGFSGGFRVFDTIAMIVCGAVAGASLAQLAAGRRRS